MPIKKCLNIAITGVLIAFTLFLLLPMRFSEYRFTCGFSKCENAGQDTSYMVEKEHWGLFGGYHMLLWQHFTPKSDYNDHWLRYNYTETGRNIVMIVSLGLGTTLSYMLYRSRT